MKLRCPYCKEALPDPPPSTCPACRKTMTIPGHIKGITATDRKRAKDHIHKQAERNRRSLVGPAPPVGRKPSHVLLILVFMIFLGVFFVARTQKTPPQNTEIQLPEELAERELRVLRIALEHFRQDCGRHPTSAEGILVLLVNPGETNWRGPYVTMTQNDPWERPYIYRQEPDRMVLLSRGPDGEEGSEDDLFPIDWTNHPALHNREDLVRAPSGDARTSVRIGSANQSNP